MTPGPIPARAGLAGRGALLQELLDAISGRPAIHDGRFGLETVRICVAIATSARERREVSLAPMEAGHVHIP
ncbi:MAG: hypothetical protein ACQSGP_04870 [Frankia sp.]